MYVTLVVNAFQKPRVHRELMPRALSRKGGGTTNDTAAIALADS